MGLVPVRESIVRGYTFLFARFFTVLGLGWMSAAFYAVTCNYLIRAVSNAAVNSVPSSGAFNGFSLGYFVAMLIVTAFFGAPMLIPFTREALGLHEEPVAAHFSYGPREWHLFVGLLRFYGIVGGALFLLIVASGLGISQLAHLNVLWLGTPLTTWLNSLSAVIVLSTAAFLSVRLGFFLGPIAAMEGRATIARAWALSAGNFWRLAAVYLAVIVPAAAVVLISEYALWGSELAAVTQKLGSNALAIFQLQYDHSAGIAAMLAGALMAVSALFGAASATAYAALGGAVSIPAKEADWGINRAPAYADARPQQFEPAASVVEPVVHAPVAEPVAQEPVHEVVAAPEPEAIAAVEERYPDPVIDAALTPAVEPEVAVDPAVAVPLEASIETKAAEDPPHAEAQSGAEPDATYVAAVSEHPPLDPAGLAQSEKQHEAA